MSQNDVRMTQLQVEDTFDPIPSFYPKREKRKKKEGGGKEKEKSYTDHTNFAAA